MEAVLTHQTSEKLPSRAVPPAAALSCPQRVLLPVDDSAESHKAVELAAKVAHQSGAEVTAVHVHPIEPRRWGPYEIETRFDAFRLVQDAVAELRRAGVRSRGIVISAPINRVGDAIGAQADRLDADLVVMGARNLSGASQLIGGSVSREVARRAHCPVTLAH
jgi:nucleotide-binding universal stress UspA family protein